MKSVMNNFLMTAGMYLAKDNAVSKKLNNIKDNGISVATAFFGIVGLFLICMFVWDIWKALKNKGQQTNWLFVVLELAFGVFFLGAAFNNIVNLGQSGADALTEFSNTILPTMLF